MSDSDTIEPMNAIARLEQYRKRSKLNQGELGELLGLSAVAISRIMLGRRRPSIVIAARIERETGIAASSWADSPVSPADRRRTRAVPNSHVSNVLTDNA